MGDWTETAIWLELTRREGAERACHSLQECMPLAEAVLRSGGTAAPDFTLHDAEHGFRVAQMMARLLQESVADMSPDELSLLLLSAYCHDIGMTPERESSKQHYQYLLTGDVTLLSVTDRREFQAWLDENWSGITPPIIDGAVTKDDLSKAEEISAYYFRHKHNDWSEQWIRGAFAAVKKVIYSGWVDDLVTLCRSHHDGLSELRASRFDARIVGSPASVVNLRYLAAVLRVADVLEFDPERTPEIILTHRSIAPKSRIFWHKDHAISFSLNADGARIIFSARTPNALIHKAVLSTAEWVDVELAACSTLEHEGAFRRGAVPEDIRNKYAWKWPARLTLDVSEASDSFVYVDGAFRPSTTRILNLLSGVALYGQPLAAVRELVQNAMDAVHEQIALERLQVDNPADVERARILSSMHVVRLSFAAEAGCYWLRCSDDGAGMTKSIIEKHLLISGSEVRAELRALERDANANGFKLGRTGQFGIGVLSYFMIADRLEINTRRSQEAGDTDGTGWRFVTEGVGAFGELSKLSRSTKGTQISLRLKSDVVGGDPEKLFISIREYIIASARVMPCRLVLRDEVGSEDTLEVGPDWTFGPERFLGQVMSSLKPPRLSDNRMLTLEEERVREADERQWGDLRERAANALRWMGPEVVDLPNQVGRARIWLPYFQLEGGNSVAFMDVNAGGLRPLPNGTDYERVRYGTEYSWKGFGAAGGSREEFKAFVEIDFVDGANISVNRKHLHRAEDYDVTQALRKSVMDIWVKFLQQNISSDYHGLNLLLSGYWRYQLKREQRVVSKWKFQGNWEELRYPLVDVLRPTYAGDERYVVGKYLGEQVDISGSLQNNDHSAPFIVSRLAGGGRVVLLRSADPYGTSPVIVWDAYNDVRWGDGTLYTRSAIFPPNWGDLICISTAYGDIYNHNHPLAILAGPECYLAHTMSKGIEHLEEVEAAKYCQKLATRFILSNVSQKESFWQAIRDRAPGAFELIWDRAGLEEDQVLNVWKARGLFDDSQMLQLRRGGVDQGQLCKANEKAPSIFSLPAVPSDDWVISVSNHEWAAATVN